MLLVFLAPGSVNHVANIVKGYAIAIGIVIAVGFVWMWWKHRQAERTLELSLRAKAVWSAWLRTAMAHPELADPGLGAIGDAAGMARYRTFVAALLAAADEILMLEPTQVWRETIARQMSLHASYLASGDVRTAVLAESTAEVRAIVLAVTGVSQPE